VPKQPRKWEWRDPKKVGVNDNDHFHVICNPSNGHYDAFWTQGSKEGAIGHHVV
jgi:hypothetical protein